MGQDPCGAGPTATAAQCARSGVTPAQYGSALLTNPAAQYNYIQGGNDQLKPETALTYTLGAVLTPIRNFTATIDYWQIKVDDVINTPDPSIIVNQCIFQGNFCNLVNREPTTGTLWLPGSGVTATLQNLSQLQSSGIDVSASYTGRMDALGGYGLLFNGSYLQKAELTPFPGLGSYDCAGYYGTQCQTFINPRWRHKLRGTWATPWNMDLALTWRHIDSVDYVGLNSATLVNDPSTAATDAHLSARDYFDFAAAWQINKTFSVRAGINNIFDQDPPITGANVQVAPFGNGNTFPQTYDALGRLIFVNLSMKF